jgi:hypothetical protein
VSNAEELVQAFVSVWNERDPARRAATVRRLWAADGRHLMGAQDIRGHDALEERVAASHRRNVIEKDYVFRPATAIDTLPGVTKFSWDMALRETGEVVSAGLGFLVVGDDGHIVCDYLFVDS